MFPLFDVISPIINKVLDFIPDPIKKAEAAAKAQQAATDHQEKILGMLMASDQAQIKVNEVEAASPSLFVSGWRPAVGWICASGLAWQYVLAPIANWAVEVGHYSTTIPKISADGLMELLFGMLGLAGMRTFEKVKDVNRI